MKILKSLLFLVIAGVLIVGIYLKATINGWLITKSSPAEIATLIVPHISVYKPIGDGPFPTILMFHGCGGIKQQQTYWAQYFQSEGFAAVVVDSYLGRNIDREQALTQVCKGRQLIGGERAGDVLTAIAWAKKQPWTDFNNLTLAGWSHGAWSIMDAFVLATNNELPHNLSSAPDASLDDVDNLILFYPYCGIADQGSEQAWSTTPNTIAITAEHDSVVGDNVCDASLSMIKKNAAKFTHKVSLGVDHAFDTRVAVKNLDWTSTYPIQAAIKATAESKQLIKRFLETNN